MELVYLWVEEYKNIHKQGFNFSPRFECKFDGENLTIDDKSKDYVSIFPDNINITAIVGENGSGKSSVLVGITNHFKLIEIKGILYSIGFSLDKINYDGDVKKFEDINIVDNIIYLDYDLIKINPIKSPFEWFNFPIYNKNLYLKVENNSVGSADFNIAKFRENLYNLIIENVESFQLDLFNFNPSEMMLSDYLSEIDSKRFTHINKLIKELKDKNFSKEKFLTFLYYNITSIMSLEIKKVEEVKDIESIESDILEHYNSNFDVKIDNIPKIYSFLEVISANEQSGKFLIEKFIPIYKEYKDVFLKLIEINYLQINFNDTKEREYFDLSQGERKLFTEMLMIFDAIKKNTKNDIFVVLDEPDLTLHPEWQKKYLYEMIKLLSNFPEKKFHFIITSHSPFILSDLPNDNIIFLKKNENGNCKNVTKETNIETFGANIHTLLSHGFFMKEGLMGEFAKGKIEEIKKFYDFNQKFKSRINAKDKIKERVRKYYLNKKEKFNHIQSIIGEPFLKTIMKNYLDELEQIFNTENYKSKQKEKLLGQFTKEELQKYLDEQ